MSDSDSDFDIVHKLDSGKLTISISSDFIDESSESDSFHFTFINTVTDRVFDKYVNRSNICNKCPILNEPDELIATLEIAPTIIIDEKIPNIVIARFTALGRCGEYYLGIKLDDVDEYMAEYARLMKVD